MTLNDLERQNRGFYGFFGDFGMRDTLQERIAPKPIEIDMDNLRIKFLALNVDFDGPSLDFQGLRKPAHESIKKRKSRDEMAGDRLTVCYRLSRVPCALAQISCRYTIGYKDASSGIKHVVLLTHVNVRQ